MSADVYTLLKLLKKSIRSGLFYLFILPVILGAGSCPQGPTDTETGGGTGTVSGSGTSSGSGASSGSGSGSDDGSDSGGDSGSGSDDTPSATPPSGPEEIPGPTAFRFPTSVTIDVGTTASGTPRHSALTLKGSEQANCTGGEFCDEINFSSNIIHIPNMMLDYIFEHILIEYEAEISPTVTRFGTTVDGRELVCDFSRYFSMKEETSKCSGSTAGDLNCTRCWYGGRRLLSGYITSKPTDRDNGAGFFLFDPAEVFGMPVPVDSSLTMCSRWDHTDPSFLQTDICYSGKIGGLDAFGGIGRVTQEGAEAITSIKTLNMSGLFKSTGSSGGVGTTDQVARWREGGLGWRGRGEIRITSSSFPFAEDYNACANIKTGVRADSLCGPDLNLIDGISFNDVPFIGPPDPSDLAIPDTSAFPPSPSVR